jgi:hypothetical protein
MKPKRAPVSGNKEVDRALSSIYVDINELSSAVNSIATPEKESHKGGSGDIRLIKRKKNDYTLEGKFEEGWAYIDMSIKDRKQPKVIKVTKLTDSTGGTVNGNILDTSVSNTSTDDLATIAAKINEIIDTINEQLLKEK